MIGLSWTAFYFASACIWSLARGSSRGFQPPIRQRPNVEPSEVYGNGSHLESRHALAARVQKRYLTIHSGAGGLSPDKWPNGVVKYCFESTATETALMQFLHDALGLWRAAGLADDKFDWQAMPSSVCDNDPDNSPQRSDFLLIMLTTRTLSSTVGKPPAPQKPRMRLSTDETVGHLNAVVNIAHEMGHVWGLYHPHQNQYLWDTQYAPNGAGSVFGTSANPFECLNLIDYSRVKAALVAKMSEAEANAKMRAACKDRYQAGDIGFSAFDYLPITQEPVIFDTSKKRVIDWTSIMVYPTGAGGATTDGGGRLPILKKPDGSNIDVVRGPSADDIQGLKLLYGVSTSRHFAPYGDKSNSKRERFLKVFRKDSQSGCN